MSELLNEGWIRADDDGMTTTYFVSVEGGAHPPVYATREGAEQVRARGRRSVVIKVQRRPIGGYDYFLPID